VILHSGSHALNAFALDVISVYNHANQHGSIMKTFLDIAAVMLILAGSVFFLQGINILPGSYMTGDPQWAVIGAIMTVVGTGLILWSKRRR
jgi:hypothetical protein